MATRPQKPQRPQKATPVRPHRPAADVSQIRAGRQPHLYVREHMSASNVDATRLAGRLGIHEKSVYKALREPSRIWKDIEAWRAALGLEDWRDLTMPPGQPSIDARMDRFPKEFRDFIRRAVGSR